MVASFLHGSALPSPFYFPVSSPTLSPLPVTQALATLPPLIKFFHGVEELYGEVLEEEDVASFAGTVHGLLLRTSRHPLTHTSLSSGLRSSRAITPCA